MAVGAGSTPGAGEQGRPRAHQAVPEGVCRSTHERVNDEGSEMAKRERSRADVAISSRQPPVLDELR